MELCCIELIPPLSLDLSVSVCVHKRCFTDLTSRSNQYRTEHLILQVQTSNFKETFLVGVLSLALHARKGRQSLALKWTVLKSNLTPSKSIIDGSLYGESNTLLKFSLPASLSVCPRLHDAFWPLTPGQPLRTSRLRLPSDLPPAGDVLCAWRHHIPYHLSTGYSR